MKRTGSLARAPARTPHGVPPGCCGPPVLEGRPHCGHDRPVHLPRQRPHALGRAGAEPEAGEARGRVSVQPEDVALVGEDDAQTRRDPRRRRAGRARDEPLFEGVRAARAEGPARLAAHGPTLQPLGGEGPAPTSIGDPKDPVHQGPRPGDPADALHGPPIEVARPGRHRHRGRVAHRPVVGEVRRRARLGGGGKGQLQRAAAPEGGGPRHGIGQHVRHQVGHRGRHHAAGPRRTSTPPRGAVLAALGERPVGVREIQEPDLAVPQREPQAVVVSRGAQGLHPQLAEPREQRPHPHPLGQHDGGHVVAVGQRGSKSQPAVVAPVVVARGVVAEGRGEVQRQVREQVRGRHARLQGQAVQEGLEGRAGLPRPGDHVHLPVLGIVEVRAADPGQDVAGGGVQHHHRGLPHAATVELGQGAPDRGLGVALKVQIQRRRERPGRRGLGQHPAGEVRRGEHGVAVHQPQRLGERLGVLRRVDDPQRAHAPQHAPLTRLSRLNVAEGVESAGRLRDAAQQRGLGQAQRARGAPQVEPGGGLDAHGAVPEGRAVQVLREDRVLVHGALQPKRQQGLAELAGERAWVGRHQPHQLLGQRAAARHHPSGAQVVARRARHALEIHAPVLGEAMVLHRHQRAGGPR